MIQNTKQQQTQHLLLLLLLLLLYYYVIFTSREQRNFIGAVRKALLEHAQLPELGGSSGFVIVWFWGEWGLGSDSVFWGEGPQRRGLGGSWIWG